jgi:hypothetical protein
MSQDLFFFFNDSVLRNTFTYINSLLLTTQLLVAVITLFFTGKETEKPGN